jgi:hypothetical protein
MKEQTNTTESNIFSDLQYICKTTPLITESLRDGCDVAQLPNGDIVVTEVKTVNTQYTWNENKQRMIRASQY